MKIRVHVRIVPRQGLLDPQGQAVEHALGALGFDGMQDVRVGKAIELHIEAASAAVARATAERMCEQLLANPVTEDFAIEIGA
ncbi:MAG TPA: phosphoribosylformylglycinamidine synthase subunit PurS [Gemmatimonadales bacterium]|jgi:phosphoribosylformylglycinamidine synthase|nr:phosphoribosylformylglycinamidine synthase subunit PurS [Gemmatimonadales bacterium]